MLTPPRRVSDCNHWTCGHASSLETHLRTQTYSRYEKGSTPTYSNFWMRERTLSESTLKISNAHSVAKLFQLSQAIIHYYSLLKDSNRGCSHLVRDLWSHICYPTWNGRVLWTLFRVNPFSLIRFNSCAWHEQKNDLRLQCSVALMLVVTSGQSHLSVTEQKVGAAVVSSSKFHWREMTIR